MEGNPRHPRGTRPGLAHASTGRSSCRKARKPWTARLPSSGMARWCSRGRASARTPAWGDGGQRRDPRGCAILDALDGACDGRPPARRHEPRGWRDVFSAAFGDMQRKASGEEDRATGSEPVRGR
ncbi:MAG: hypothetical protein MZU91_14385 [Desulfosudis oleivorans]|nr:hypothetical protein [Desulfosudis oleivorans]